MRKSRFTEPQIMAVLRQAESGVAVPELCREHGISTASFYKWRSKYGGMDASMMSQMKSLEDENRRLKRMFADLSMQADLLKEALGKKGHGQLNAGSWPRRQWRRKGLASRWPVGHLVSARPAFATARSAMLRTSPSPTFW